MAPERSARTAQEKCLRRGSGRNFSSFKRRGKFLYLSAQIDTKAVAASDGNAEKSFDQGNESCEYGGQDTNVDRLVGHTACRQKSHWKSK